MTIKLANLQVVIFSRNRHVQLTESLRYWDQCGIETLVLHNTQEPLSLLDIPPTTEYIVHQGSFAERCEIASRNLKFNFYIIASDDERYLPTALSKMVEQLEDFPELSSVGGQAVGIMRHGLKFRTTLAYKSQLHYFNLSTDYQSRLAFHYESGRAYSGAMYRVYRKDQFRSFLRLISRFSDISTPYIFEVTAELFWTLIGPAKYVDEVFWVRNWIVPPIQTGDWNRKLYFHEWSQNLKYQNEFESWKEMMSEEFELLKNDSNVYTGIVFHRAKVEQNERMRNQALEKRKLSRIRELASKVFSILSSKFKINELDSQLSESYVNIRKDELITALTSMTK